MTVQIDTADDGSIRLEFRRNRKDGKKPDRILMSIAPAMKCFMTDFIVVYGRNIPLIWSIAPGEKLIVDDYQYDREADTHTFLLEGKEQLKLQSGDYILPMDEFWATAFRDHPQIATRILQ